MESERGRQIRALDAGRSDRRASGNDAASARRAAQQWWAATTKAWREAYSQRHATPQAQHAAEVRFALTLAFFRQARERVRRCETAHGAPAANAAPLRRGLP